MKLLPSRAASPASTRPTLGVEIEGVGIAYEDATPLLRRHGWKYVYDGSVRDDRPAHEYERASTHKRTGEAVSPIIPYDRRHLAPEMLAKLRKRGMRVNGSCGQHLHLGAQNLSVDTLLHLLLFWKQNEYTLDRMLGKRMGRAGFVRSLSPKLMDVLAYVRPSTRRELLGAWRLGCEAIIQETRPYFSMHSAAGQGHVDSVERYWGLNFASLRKHGTIEFRAFEATMEPRRMEANITLAYALVELAQHRGTFAEAHWEALQAPTVARLDLAGALGPLSLPMEAFEHFVCMAEQAQWALAWEWPALRELAEKQAVHGEASPSDDWMEAAHRSAEACLVGAKHVDLRGLSLVALPPCLAGLRTLESLDLRGNQLSDWSELSELARRLTLRLADNALPQEMGLLDQHAGHWLEAAYEWAQRAEERPGRALPGEAPWRTARRVYRNLMTQSSALTLGPGRRPPLMEELQHVRALTLEQVEEVPGWVRSFSSLQMITFKWSRVEALPEWLLELPTLVCLDVRNNTPRLPFPPRLAEVPTFKGAAGFRYGLLDFKARHLDKGGADLPMLLNKSK